jgi:nitrite reductase (NADH) small subunit
MSWVDVIRMAELEPELGVPALVEGTSVAVFRTHAGEVHALSNYDPKTHAPVMARGIVGSRGDIPVIASPMYKQVFDLRTGRCLDDENVTLTRYDVRVVNGIVQVRRS